VVAVSDLWTSSRGAPSPSTRAMRSTSSVPGIVAELPAVDNDVAAMFDLALRPLKDRALSVAARWCATRVPPGVVTAVALVACVSAGVAGASHRSNVGVGLWLLGRTLDGLDGAIARARSAATDLGGYVDMVADTLGYAAVPIGVAAGSHDRHAWMLAAVLLASFYVNAVSWTYLSALAEKRAVGSLARGESTSIHMPAGLIEGLETIVLFALMLGLPRFATMFFSIMAVLVAITIGQRLVTARQLLREPSC
jgi:phosphatidylglycerophosphate synthase